MAEEKKIGPCMCRYWCRTLARIRADDVEHVRLDDLAAYYRAWGIDLSFPQGLDFDHDPTDARRSG
ncbi:hypothetical protein LJR084_007300 [Variovorax sp. LjRoot84]|uniref:hypothetical protein n=1 Tax=Variovorax sp. LjRoot84 TaxID=3342340 RepID=UPI003ECF2454